MSHFKVPSAYGSMTISYEYLFAWSLRLDGTIELEIKLTGILNLYTMAEGEKAGAFGTEVAPRVVAHHHQRELQIALLAH